MESTQPPRRKAAIKATTNLAESSSDDGNNSSNDSDEYHATSRARGSKSKKEKRGTKVQGRKSLVADSQDFGSKPLAGTCGRKRKRVTSKTIPWSLQKRHCGSDIPAKDSIDNDSDLTPLSSDDEQDEVKPFVKALAEFPLQLTSLSPSSKQRKSRARQTPALALSSSENDSDDLPDIGLVLLQRNGSTRKGEPCPKSPDTTRKRKQKRRSQQHDNPSSSAPSPTLPPYSLPRPSRRNGMESDTTTEPNISDHSDLHGLSDDSDLDMDAVTADELCFAKARASETVYWPAKVLQAKKVPSTSREKGKQKKMYRVMFLDKKEKDIPRNWFYISSQEEFYKCAIGQFESSHIDVVNDIDEDSRQTSSNVTNNRSSSLRSPSPIDLSSLPLLSGPDYCDLPLPLQFAYVTPILKAIMNEKATWALRRHKMYLGAGVTRDKLKTEGGLKGAVDAKNADDFSNLLQKWCLGARGRDFVGDVDEEIHTGHHQSCATIQDESENQDTSEFTSAVLAPVVSPQEPLKLADISAQWTTTLISPPIVGEGRAGHLNSTIENPERTVTEPIVTQQERPIPPQNRRPRQHGSPSYEKLPPRDKAVYCLEVLLPEALNQILLWRTGERKSVEVMWDNVEAEKRMHERGEELLRETDWVMDIMRLRRALVSTSRNGSKGILSRDSSARTNDKVLRRTRSGKFGDTVGSYKE